jgi:hypothetical protein
MSGSSYPLNMGQIKADLFIAEATIDEVKQRTSKEGKYLKGQAAYHLQQAAEKLIKIQIYYAVQQPDPRKLYKHAINELINYAQSLGIIVIIPQYIEDKKLVLSSWEAEGRYDVHMTVKITQLEKAFEEIRTWCEELQEKGFK